MLKNIYIYSNLAGTFESYITFESAGTFEFYIIFESVGTFESYDIRILWHIWISNYTWLINRIGIGLIPIDSIGRFGQLDNWI